jgi:hypothetical protein
MFSKRMLLIAASAAVHRAVSVARAVNEQATVTNAASVNAGIVAGA